jgi:hypothetical protein
MSKESSFSITTHHFPDGIVDYIEKLSYELPWFYFKDCAFGNSAAEQGLEMHPYFSHTFLKDNEIDPHFFQRMPWNDIGKFIGLPNNKMIRAHNTLQYPRPDAVGKPHNIHVDQHFPHIVGLYYPNDSDGDTFFFDSNLNVIHKEPVERGKMVVFDGKWRHSSSSPSKNIRLSLNINYEPSPRTSNS